MPRFQKQKLRFPPCSIIRGSIVACFSDSVSGVNGPESGVGRIDGDAKREKGRERESEREGGEERVTERVTERE